ncbi:spore coat protein [Viridibacillus sp. YIM B01967]|uniref:Spore coat protein n=1 Tax=Viridibacillus soli TaxID=2798301 RepID=A0ABS1H9B8_9BACL|nr:spore coat protein [Viridibacillus soli]MBK3496013.1 spore coat protein [Viridibacillus soli]
MHQAPNAMMNHGGHEVISMRETLSASIGMLNHAIILREHVQDPELLDILDRQYKFSLDEYNITVEAFRSGLDPSHPTGSYQMKLNHNFTYGLQPSQPKKPMTNASELNDEMISGYLLGGHKTIASGKTMTALETTNPVVRRVLADSIPNCIEMAYELSLYQNKHQYYQVEQLNGQDMQTLLNSFAPGQNQPMQ